MTAYEIRISGGSSDVCSSDLLRSQSQHRRRRRSGDEEEAVELAIAQRVCCRARAERESLKIRLGDAEGPQHKLGIDARAGARAIERDALALDVGHGLDARLGAHHQVEDRKRTRLNSSH